MGRYYIYKITNTVNNKSYIGFTSKSVDLRWDVHLRNARQMRNCYLYDAINKYGADKFTREVIYCSLDGEHTLREMEPYFIKEYNTFFTDEYGYNMTRGGEGALGVRHSEESRASRAQRNKGEKNPFYGKHHTDEVKQKVGEAVKKTRHLRVGESAPFSGHKHSEDSKKKIGDTQGGTWLITFPDGHTETIVNLVHSAGSTS